MSSSLSLCVRLLFLPLSPSIFMWPYTFPPSKRVVLFATPMSLSLKIVFPPDELTKQFLPLIVPPSFVSEHFPDIAYILIETEYLSAWSLIQNIRLSSPWWAADFGRFRSKPIRLLTLPSLPPPPPPPPP